MSLFPIFLKLEKRKCVVVGAGTIAAGKAAGLLSAGARVVVIAPRGDDWIQQQARAGNLIWEQREFSAEDLPGATLVVAATNSIKTNEAVFRACGKQGVLCNVVDDPDHCDFFYPSVVRRGPLQIAISTAGQSPSLARRLRKELEQQFGPEYGPWVEQLGKMRADVLRRGLSAKERQALIDELSSRTAFEQFVATQPRAQKPGPLETHLNDDAPNDRKSPKR
jgi:precorrin-2 dehydrogenase